MIRLLPALLLLTATVAAAHPAANAHVVTIAEHLLEGEWAAIRVNVTRPSDLRIVSEGHLCRFGETESAMLGPFGFGIRDGEHSRTPHFTSFSWGPRSDSVEIGVNGHHERLPENEAGARSCNSVHADTALWGDWLPQRDFTSIPMAFGPQMWVNMTMTWTHGVDSFDVARGAGVALTKARFDDGVYASVYPVVSLGAGAGMRYDLAPTNDLVGFFAPKYERGEPGIHAWRCERDGVPCEVDQFGAVEVESKGPASWTFAIDVEADSEKYYYALGAVELPDGSYLY